MPSTPRIDMHCHVGLLGDRWPELGRISEWMRAQLTFRVFLAFARIPEDKVCDVELRKASLRTIETSGMDRVVCLALDPVHDEEGRKRVDLSHMWIDNAYILQLQKELPDRIEFGASVHPYAADFRERVARCVDDGAVLLKWLPSAQQIDLAHPKTREALLHLATARAGEPLPLLLHVGPEYAIPTTDPRTRGWDFLSWSLRDELLNRLRRRRNRWHRPNVVQALDNLRAARDAGAVIILAHCGLPYFDSGLLPRLIDHSDFDVVKMLLESNSAQPGKGAFYGDVSAFATPFRELYFKAISKLPSQYLLFGSDFPTPALELSADLDENLRDFRAMLEGDLTRIIVPQDNLLDVNWRELWLAFPNHPMFTNAISVLGIAADESIPA